MRCSRRSSKAMRGMEVVVLRMGMVMGIGMDIGRIGDRGVRVGGRGRERVEDVKAGRKRGHAGFGDRVEL